MATTPPRPRDEKGRFLPYVTPTTYAETEDLFLTDPLLCTRCGALVGDQKTHTAFHLEIDRRTAHV